MQYESYFVKSFGWYENNEDVFLTMEYMPLGDLNRYLNSPLQEKESKCIVAQIVEGLQIMHGYGFAHRDLKPAVSPTAYLPKMSLYRKFIQHRTYWSPLEVLIGGSNSQILVFQSKRTMKQNYGQRRARPHSKHQKSLHICTCFTKIRQICHIRMLLISGRWVSLLSSCLRVRPFSETKIV